MKLAALRFAARRPLLSLGLGTAALVGLVASAVATLGPAESPAPSTTDAAAPAAPQDALVHVEDDAQAKDPRLILNRLWLDRLPRRATDEVDLWIFFGGGIGVHEHGSRWDGKYEIFDLERRGASLDVTYLQTKKKVTTSFEIDRCDDEPPFNLCLVLKDLPGGPVKLYGFDYDDDMDRAVPWGRATRESARTKTSAPRD